MAEEQIDRISQLSDDILISILSLLPTRDVARTNLLSKAWRKLSAFSSLPVLMFESPDFLASPRKDTDVSSFINAIDSYLKLRQKDASLAKLRLYLHLNDVESRALIDSWIDAALERKVKELDLFMLPRGRARGKPYSLPAKIFAARTINVLSLRRVILEICGDIDLPALRKLYLGEILFVSSCPLIDCLHIESCHGLQNVSGLANLRRLEVLWCYELKRIEINAPSLQYLSYQQGKCPCDVVLRACEFLRDLFKNLVSGLPSLEGLGIRRTQLQRIEISHHQLKRLDLSLTEKQSKAKLKIDTPNLQSFKYDDTPNLQSFKYDGHRMPLASLISSMNTSSLQEAEIHFLSFDNYSHLFIPQLREFFEKLKHCQVIKLLIKSKRELILPRKLRPILSPPVYDIKHLYITVNYRSRYQYIIYRLLWMFHPQTLSISPKEHPKYCTSCTTKCWRHYLEDVQIDGDESKSEIDRITTMPESSTFMNCEVRFRLKWRSQLL
ncbi:hypothetical protein PVL29_011906 [Vitis rotundifolia]|uniref:F-box domain-containing protein n=1 Tax=Vitis rotundifolia TaxID=103349 RepID=A0AA38ZQ89_VITRO|nr:hypothetical protein PVL29_011906 [Vitis rotundifolia]